MSLSDENPQQRRNRYVRMANDATRVGESDKRLSVRETCLQMAESWLKLANSESVSDQQDPGAPKQNN